MGVMEFVTFISYNMIFIIMYNLTNDCRDKLISRKQNNCLCFYPDVISCEKTQWWPQLEQDQTRGDG